MADWARNISWLVVAIMSIDRMVMLDLNQRLSKKNIATIEAIAKIIAGILIVSTDTPRSLELVVVGRERVYLLG